MALALAVAVLVCQARVVVGGKTWDDRRYQTEIAPPRIAAATEIRSGTLPQWWDGAGLGVPLVAEPSHGAAYPPLWLATDTRALDLTLVVHLFWLALGVALWARRDSSELGALVAGVLVATTGVIASTALRGALPAVAHLPWIGWAATGIAAATSRPERARLAAIIGVLVGAIALTGELGVVIDAFVIALVLGLRRANLGWLAIGLGTGLAIGAFQWIPALHAHGAGAIVHGITPSRLVELVVPGSFGSQDPDRAVAAIAGTVGWAPSLFAGAPLVALAAVTVPARRVAAVMIAFTMLALVVGRGGWPAIAGAPELHLAALVVIAAVCAAAGVDAFVAGERRATIAIAGGAVVAAIVLGAVIALRSDAPAIGRAVLDGALGVACMAAALFAVQRVRPIALALLVAPSVGALHATAPTIDRGIVDDVPAWAKATTAGGPPRRLYRPAKLDTSADDRVDEAIATLAAPARWNLALANTTDPARSPSEDRVWIAASHGGGTLLERYAIELAVLPAIVTGTEHFTELGRRGTWSLVRYPAMPIASVIGNWMWIPDETAALARLFPPAGARDLGRGRVVLAGTGVPSEEADATPTPCTVERWDPGAIDLACTAEDSAYAVVSSAAAPGWSVAIDGSPAPWVTADVIRRAVALPAGAHHVRWRFRAPGLATGAAISGRGIALLAALGWLARRR